MYQIYVDRAALDRFEQAVVVVRNTLTGEERRCVEAEMTAASIAHHDEQNSGRATVYIEAADVRILR